MTDKKQDALATVPAGMEEMVSFERPAGADEGELGNEGIGREDVLIPRLGIAQKMSPEIDPTNEDRYIDGLQFTDLFNSLTKQRYGKGPLHFVVLRRYDPRWIEFVPIDQGGGIKDMNVPANDPRTLFTTGPNNERIKPAATMFYDYIVLLLTGLDMTEPMKNVIALSLKSSGIKAAKQLNMLINQRGKKLICKGVYELRSGSAKNKKSGGVYATYNVNNAGWLKPDSQVERLAIEMFEGWKERTAKIDVDAHGDDVDDSLAANPEPEGAATEM